MSAAKSAAKPLIDLDGRFGLHPSMSAFEPLFKEKRLAIVHGIGSPNTTRRILMRRIIWKGNAF